MPPYQFYAVLGHPTQPVDMIGGNDGRTFQPFLNYFVKGISFKLFNLLLSIFSLRVLLHQSLAQRFTKSISNYSLYSVAVSWQGHSLTGTLCWCGHPLFTVNSLDCVGVQGLLTCAWLCNVRFIVSHCCTKTQNNQSPCPLVPTDFVIDCPWLPVHPFLSQWYICLISLSGIRDKYTGIKELTENTFDLKE